MAQLVYTIRDWDKHYEVSQSRKIDGPMSWVAMPCKHDGLGFRRIMRQPDGPAIYAAWVLIVQMAAKCPERGTLRDANGPLDAADMHLKTGCPEKVFSRALNYLSSNEIGWLLVANWEHATGQLPLQDRTEQDITKQDKTGCVMPAKPSSTPAPAPDPTVVAYPEFPCIPGRKAGAATWLLTEAKIAELARTFPAVDVPGECRRAHAWVKANLGRRKTAGGMDDFLFRWMTREQNAGRSNGRGMSPKPVCIGGLDDPA